MKINSFSLIQPKTNFPQIPPRAIRQSSSFVLVYRVYSDSLEYFITRFNKKFSPVCKAFIYAERTIKTYQSIKMSNNLLLKIIFQKHPYKYYQLTNIIGKNYDLLEIYWPKTCAEIINRKNKKNNSKMPLKYSSSIFIL